MGSPERRQREREEMRQLICRTAMKLFLDEGFEKVSMRAIAEKIEYTPGALYSYFEDKDAILYTLHEQGFAMLRERLAGVEAALAPFDRLEAMGRLYLGFALENPEYYDLMFISGSIARTLEDDDKDWEPGRSAYDLLRQQVRRCQEEGSLPAHDLESATFSMWALVHGIASLAIKGRLVMVPPEHAAEATLAAFAFNMKGMRQAPPT